MVLRNSTHRTMTIAKHLFTALLALSTTTALLAQRTPEEALRALQDGNRRFATDHSITQPVGEGVRRTLARGESPFAVVLCCADSRVPPEHIFNAGLGELFVVRVVGHSADPETIASIENAVEQLGASLCVVLGHEQCDSIAAAIAQVESPTHGTASSQAMQSLLEGIEPAVRKVKTQDLGGKLLCDRCEEEHAHATLAQVMRRSALLRRYESVGKFKMVAARYHLTSGEVEWLPNRPLPTDPQAAVQIVPGSVPNSMPPHVAFRLLQAGHRRFLSDSKPTADLTTARRAALATSQQPPIVVLTCADSRVTPEHLFDAGLGELLVVRIGGNTLNDSALASIEYAAGQLGSSLLVVLGHTKCNTLQAAADAPAKQNMSPHQRALLQRLEPAVATARGERGGRDLLAAAAESNALRMLAEARSRSGLLRALEHDGRFAMLAGVYDIASGDIEWMKDKEAAASAEPQAHAKAPAKAAPNGHEHATTQAAPTTGTATAHGDAAHAGKPDPHAESAHSTTSAAPAHGAEHAPAPAHGETAHGETAHGHASGTHEANPPTTIEWAHQPDEHAAAGHGHGKADAHGQAQPAPQGETAAHGATPAPHGDGHAASHAPDAHAASPAAHGDAAHQTAQGDHGHASVDPHAAGAGHGHAAGTADPHGSAKADAHGHAHPHAAAPAPVKGNTVAWNDPIVLVGISGIVSLLVAAVLAMKK